MAVATLWATHRWPAGRWSCPLLAALCLIVTTVSRADSPPPREDFDSVERLTVVLQAPGEQEEHPMEIRFDAHRYRSVLWLKPAAPTDELPAAERFLVRMLQANGQGTPEEVLALWSPEDRPEVRTLVSNEVLFNQNQRFFRNLSEAGLHMKVYYGAYVIFFVQYHSPGEVDSIQALPITRQGDEYFMTQALKADPVFAYLTTAYAKQLPIEERANSHEQ